jgi:beta-glucanase (GH16 family)
VTDLVEVKNGSLFLHFNRDTVAGNKYASVEPWGSQGQQFWWTGDDVQLTREYLVNTWVSAGAIRSMGTDYTRRMFEHGYGWYEARIKFPKVAGTMGAFWLMSNTFNREGNKGQYGTEIDILESIGNAQGTWDFALHWGIPGSHESYFRDFKQPNKLNNGQNLDIYDGEFHVFALDWSPSGYVFYINNIEMGKIPNDGGNRVNNLQVNRNPNYIKFSMESAFWDAPLPDDFTSGSIVIDYIRVYNQPQIR